jgi:GH35 family endo-1,4-beta-xylanase
VTENAMKWKNHDSANLDEIDAALTWLADHDIPVRGHTLIWPGWRNMAPEAQALENDHAALRAAVEQRVHSSAERYAGRVIDWDVINEPITNHDMMDIFGNQIMADWFRIAREADPSAVLYINDFGILSGGTRTTSHQTGYHKVIEDLLATDAPVQGIGMQGHFSANLTPPDRLMEILDWYTELGLPIKVTEFDIDIRQDRQLQSDYLRDFMTVLFSHPNVEGIIMWGFWEGRHWRPDAALYTQDWSIRPHGQMWRDLVFDKWWTSETTTTDDSGMATVRGFLGDYRITVLHNGRKWSFDANLAGQATQVRLALE